MTQHNKQQTCDGKTLPTFLKTCSHLHASVKLQLDRTSSFITPCVQTCETSGEDKAPPLTHPCGTQFFCSSYWWRRGIEPATSRPQTYLRSVLTKPSLHQVPFALTPLLWALFNLSSEWCHSKVPDWPGIEPTTLKTQTCCLILWTTQLNPFWSFSHWFSISPPSDVIQKSQTDAGSNPRP